MVQPSIERVMEAAQVLKAQGFGDVVPLLMAKQARAIRENKARRRRGVQVRLLGGRAKAVLDEARVEELAGISDF